MLSCQRCDKTHSRPDAFLLTCRACTRNWHHRCLMPPMEDKDLIELIRATNEGNTANDLGSWTCRRCKKHASVTPSATTSSREQTASSELHEGSKSSAPSPGPAVRDTTSAAVREETSMMVDATDRERNRIDRQESTETALLKRTLVSGETKSSAVNQSHVQPRPGPAQPTSPDVQLAGPPPATLTLQERKRVSQRPTPITQSHPFKAARKLGSVISTTSSEDDIETQADPPPFSELSFRVSQVPSSVTSGSVRIVEALPSGRAANEQRPTVRTESQLQVNQAAADDIYDDPEDLYGPPVERRIVRILPSLAEELREQQRRVTAEKEKRRTPLASDWVLARHANDPSWKEIPTTEGRKRRKTAARKLGENGLNVNELMGCFTVENWVRDHKN